MAFHAELWHVCCVMQGSWSCYCSSLDGQERPVHYSASLFGFTETRKQFAMLLPSLGISLPSVQKFPQANEHASLRANIAHHPAPVSWSTYSGNHPVRLSWPLKEMLLGRCLATSRGRDVLSEKKAVCNSRSQLLRYVNLCRLRHSNRQKGIQAPQSGSECALRVPQERVQRKLEGKS
jgi:hypothetical protein